MMGFICAQMPVELRKSGMPDSVLIPAPVNTAARSDASRRRRSRETSDARSMPGACRRGRRATRRGGSGRQPSRSAGLQPKEPGMDASLLAVSFDPNEKARAAVTAELGGSGEAVYLPPLDDAARREALRNAAALLSRNTGTELRDGEPAL